MEIFDVKSKYFIIHDRFEKEQKMIQENRREKNICSGNRIKTITGLEVCGEVSYPNASMNGNTPYFPFTGPVTMSLTISKQDIPNGFQIIAKKIQSKEATLVQLALNTPGSQTDRALSVDFTLNHKQKELKASIISPWKKATLEGSLQNDKDKKSVNLILLNEKDEYAIESSVNIAKNGQITTYTPLVEFRRPQAERISLKGTVVSDNNKEIEADLKLSGATERAVNMKGKYVNIKKMKSVSGSVALSPKEVYSAVATVIIDQKKTSMTKILPKFLIKTPQGALVSLSGSADYKTDKSLKTDLTLEMDRVLKKPIKFKASVTKNSSPKKGAVIMKIRSSASLICQAIILKTSSSTIFKKNKKAKTLSTRFDVDYNMLSIRKKNKISLSSKLIDRSTSSLNKYTGNMNLDVKYNPEYNVNVDLDLNHNIRHSEVDMKVRHGQNVKDKKDKSQELYVSGTVNHKINLPAAKVEFVVKAVYPPKNVDYHIKGKHEQDKKFLDSEVSMKYSPNNKINMTLSLKNESKSFLKMAGNFALDYSGREFRISTDLTQRQKVDYFHSFNVQLNEGKRYTISSTYRNPGSSSLHEIISDIQLHDQIPMKFTGAVNLKLKKFILETLLERDGKQYGVDVTSDIRTTDPSGKWTLDLKCPYRNITALLEGGKQGKKYIGKFDTSWDANKDRSQRITADATFNFQKDWQNVKLGGNIDITTPFKPFQQMSVTYDYSDDISRYSSIGKITWDRKVISTDVKIAKPISKNNFNVSMIVSTPIQGYRTIQLDLGHSLQPLGILSSFMRASCDVHYIEAAISGHIHVSKLIRDVKGTAILKSSIDKYKSFMLTGEHKDDLHKFTTKSTFELNDEIYDLNHDMTLSKVGWYIQGSGKTILTSPKCRVIVNWNHYSNKSTLKTTLTSEWGFEGEKFHIDLHSNHQFGIRRNINSGLVIQSPWEPVQDIEVAMSHDFGEGYAKRHIYYKQNKRIKASLMYNYERNSKGIDFDFYHSNPYMEDILGNLNTRPSETTKTGHMEVTWAPRQKIMVDGSFTSQAKEYYDGEMRISTPFNGFESMVGHFEHDKVSSVWVSKANVEYGFNKKVEVETNIGFDKIKKLGLSVKTPYQEMSHFEGSMQYSGNVKAFKSQANIKIIPVLENMGVELKWNAKKDFSGNFKLVSPYEHAELLDITALSKTVEQGRKSTLEIAYRKNNNKIVLDNMYNLKNWTDFKIGFTLDTPFIQMTHMEADTSFLYQNGRVEADASLKTPFKRFEDLQMELKHSNSYKQAQTHILLKYSPRKHFIADAKFGWADAIHGEVTVKTPYENYEITQLNFKHDGPPTKFQTHADLSYANKKIISDLKFVNVDGVQGIFTFSSPFSNFKNVQAEFSSEGELKNFKATGTLNFGDIPKVITTSLAHTSQKKLFQVYFELQTPYLEDIKLSVNHNGKPERFTTKISAASGKKYHLDSAVEFNEKKKTLSTNTEIGYIFKDKGRQFSFQFKGNGEPKKFNFDLSGIYDNRNLNLTTSFSKEGTSMSGSVDIKTPFEGYRNLGLSFDHHGPWRKFKSSGTLKLVNNTEYRGSVSMDIPDVKHIDAVVELYLPIDGLYPLNKVYYSHNIGDQQADVNAEVIYKGINRLAAVVNTKMSPLKEFSIKIESPFKDYRTIIGSGSYEEYFKVHKVNGRFKVENDVEIGVISSLDLSTVPILFTVTINTPYLGFEKIDITASHQGDHTNFMTSASFDSPKTKRMSATTSFKYFSPNEMEGEATFKSRLQNFTDIKLILRQAVRNGFHEKQVEVGWAPGKEIIIDGSYKFENNWRGQQINGQFNLKTPFDILKDVHAKLDHTHAKELLTDIASAEYNGKTYLDVMSRYSISMSNKRNYRIDIKEPRPMLLTISGRLDKDNVDVDAYINWNKNNADSNFKLLTLFKNKPHLSDLERNYKFKLVHPVRTMGFEGNFINNKQMYKSQALVTWDEKKGSTFSYDVQMHNKTTRYRKDYDASVKIGVPMRSVKMTSGYSDGRGIRSYDYAIFWDVDRDENKQVGAKVSVESERPLKKLDLTLLLPSIDKTYKLSTEVSKDVGSTMFYGKSELSYHPNPIHNLVLSARLEDVAISQTGKNYSLSLSLSHPITGVNVVMTSHVGKADNKASAGTEVLYLASDRQNKNFALRGEIDQLRKMLNFEILSPIKSVEIRGEATPGIPYRLQLINTFDQQKHVTIDLLVDSNKKELDLTMNYDPDDPRSYININGHYVNSTFIQAEIFRQDGHERLSEGTVALRLNTSHILHTRITWRPTIIPEIQQLISNKIQTNVYIMNNVYNGASQAVGNELRMKYSAFSREMGLEMAPLLHFMDTEIKSMEGQLKAFSRELKRAYDRNDLHIKDMGRTINEWFTEVLTAYQELVSEFKVSYNELEEVMKEMSNVIQKYPLREKYAEMVNQGVGLIRQYQQIFTARINDLMYKSDELSAALYAKYRATTRHLQRKLHEITRIITENPHISFMLDKYNEMKNKIDYLPDIDLGKLVGAVDNGIQSSLSPHMMGAYKSIVYNTRSIIKAQIQDLMKQKEFKQLHDLSKEMHAQAVWAYKYLDVKENFKAAMMKTLDLTKEILFEELNNLKEGLVNLKKSRVIVFDTQHGEIQFELYLPIPLKSLQDPLHLGIKKYIRKMQNFVTNYLPSQNSSFWDVYYQSRLGTDDVRTWLPPFRAYASVLGDQHYVTFDQRHFDFAARCSYVLARDMVDDNFTIVMNYDNNAEQKSIMVLLKGLTIEVSSNNQVSANNRKVELPFVSESVSVVSNQGIIKIDNGHGLTVDCYTKHEIYTIGLPGWYFGKIAGLLGTYDNEDSNDMMTAEKKITKDIQIFASSWEIGRRRCVTENNARRIEKIKIPECSHLFTDTSSPFRSCFRQVKPESFEEACIDYIQNKRLTDGKCRAARQYIGVCKNQGVHLNMLDNCVTCKGPNGDFKQGSIVDLNSESVDPKKRTPRSADIILIVEEKQCNNDPVQILPGIVTRLEKTLKQAGIINNRYGLIGYGGDNNLHTEHINTIDGGEFAEAGVFLKGTENLRLSNSTLAADNQAAIRLATEYPFRMGVSKILILMPCSICEFNMKHIDMDSLLKTQGFTLHILRQENFTLPVDATLKGTTIYGMDQFTVHTTKPENQASVFNAITKPTDVCANLAFHTNGSLFDVSHLVTSNLRQHHFISAFVNYINDAAIPPSCQVCECQTNRLMNARTVCRPCEHSFSLWNYIPRWWSEQDDIKHGVYKNQLQGFIEAVKKTKVMDMKSL